MHRKNPLKLGNPDFVKKSPKSGFGYIFTGFYAISAPLKIEAKSTCNDPSDLTCGQDAFEEVIGPGCTHAAGALHTYVVLLIHVVCSFMWFIVALLPRWMT